MKNITTLQCKRSITAFLGVLLYFSSLSAQTMQDTIIAHFSLMERIPKEKLYLHLDKPFYGAGEKIWFKGYLVNANTHQDNAQSNFIITELINRSDSIVERKKSAEILWDSITPSHFLRPFRQAIITCEDTLTGC